MTVRPYTLADDSAILELLRLNTPQYFAESEEADLLDYLSNRIDHYYIVEIDDIIMWCGGFNRTPDGKSGVLSWDIIHPDSQGKGVGSALAQHRIKTMQELGVDNISVRTSQHAYKFYEKMGFTLKEVIKDYWATGFDMYDMIHK